MNPLDKIDSLYFRICPALLMAAFFAVLFNKLSMMQLSGLLGYGGAFVTSLFAICSLMYARARAVSDQAEMALRAKIADDSLKAALIAVMGVGITAYVFLGLADDYPAQAGHILDKKGSGPAVVPILTAAVFITIFAVPIVAKMMSVVEMTVENMGLRVGRSKL
jgi:hypothetical protein